MPVGNRLMGWRFIRITVNYLIHRFNRIVGTIILFFLWTGAMAAAVMVSLWSFKIGHL
ncbi:hypothetical protein OAG63_01590 [Methylacidiphilales bacterium]|nr:hypothetical protein [Candidatus Methylacidiphilales bacterium]